MGANTRGRGGVDWAAEPPLNRTTGVGGLFAILNAANPDYPDPEMDPDPNQGILGSSYHSRHYGFGSMHREGVNFVMLDGSVRMVARTDDWQSLYQMFGAFDNQRPQPKISTLGD